MVLEILKYSTDLLYILDCFNLYRNDKEIQDLARKRFKDNCMNKMDKTNIPENEEYLKIDNYSTLDGIFNILKMTTKSKDYYLIRLFFEFAETAIVKYLKDPNVVKKLFEIMPDSWLNDPNKTTDFFLLGIYKLHIDNAEIKSLVEQCRNYKVTFEDISSQENILQTLQKIKNGQIRLNDYCNERYLIDSQILRNVTDSDFMLKCYSIIKFGIVSNTESIARYYLELPYEEKVKISELLKKVSLDMLIYFNRVDCDIQCSGAYANHPSHGLVGKAGEIFLDNISDRQMVIDFLDELDFFASSTFHDLGIEIMSFYRNDDEIKERIEKAFGKKLLSSIVLLPDNNYETIDSQLKCEDVSSYHSESLIRLLGFGMYDKLSDEDKEYIFSILNTNEDNSKMIATILKKCSSTVRYSNNKITARR